VLKKLNIIAFLMLIVIETLFYSIVFKEKVLPL